MARTTFTGPVASTAGETDGALFVSGPEFFTTAGTWVVRRDAAGDYMLRRTSSGSETPVCAIALGSYFSAKIGADPNLDDHAATHEFRGVQLKSATLIYRIGTAVLTTHTVTLKQTTYANNVASSIAIPSTTTGTLATATQTNPYVTTLTVATPYVIGNNTANVIDWLEINLSLSTAVYDLYGVSLAYNYNLL